MTAPLSDEKQKLTNPASEPPVPSAPDHAAEGRYGVAPSRGDSGRCLWCGLEDHAGNCPMRTNYDAEAEWTRLLSLEVDAPMAPPYERVMAFLKIWANSYLSSGNYWDVPRTMSAALKQCILILEKDKAQERAGLAQTDLVTIIRALEFYVKVDGGFPLRRNEHLEAARKTLAAIHAAAPAAEEQK